MKLWEHPLAIVGIGVVLLVFGVYTRVQSLRSRSWPAGATMRLHQLPNESR